MVCSELNASVYTVSLHMYGASMFAFKFFKSIYRYAKWSRTWNMFLFLVVWQKFKSPSYECFFFVIQFFLQIKIPTYFSEFSRWAILELESNEKYLDKIQAFAAGMLEGTLSWLHIYWHWTNTIEQPCIHKEQFCDNIRNFLLNNTANIRKKAERNDKIDPFWHQVANFQNVCFGFR